MMTAENESSNQEIINKVGNYLKDLSILPKIKEDADARRKIHRKIQKQLNLINDPETKLAVQAYYDGTGTNNPYQ